MARKTGRILINKIFVSAVLFAISLTVRAQGNLRPVTVSGYVHDKSSGEAVIGATVYVSDKSAGTASNDFGFYTLTLKPGKYEFVCTVMGYEDAVMSVDCSNGPAKVDFLLAQGRRALEAAVVYSRSKKDALVLPQMGLQTVDVTQIKKLPAFLGESDIIRVIQMMPGVQSPSEGSTGFSVRGGGADQNLILLDGAPVYNSGHFLGFLSMFNGDVIKNAQLYKGDFPAKYGGKNSSVLDIATSDGNKNAFGGNASVGLLTSKVYVNGPIVPGKLSFFLAGRRSYLDVFFPLIKRLPQGTKLAFYDVNAKLSWSINDNNRLYFSVFSGRDKLGWSIEDLGLSNSSMAYSNNTQSIKWSHIFSPKLISSLSLYNSMYMGLFDCNMKDTAFEWRNNLNETGARYHYSWQTGPHSTICFGVDGAYYYLNPSECHPKDGNSAVVDVVSPQTGAWSAAAFAEHEQKAGRLNLRYGLRFSTYTKEAMANAGAQTYFGLDPRISASLVLDSESSLKAAYSRTHQYLEKAAITAGGMLDTWFSASSVLKPQISDQVSLGINRNFMDDALECSVEGFYKYNQNTIDLKDNSGLVIIESDPESQLRSGLSYAYGVELMARYEFSKVNGWLGYTWTRAMFEIEGINDGLPYRSPMNHEHAVNFVINWDISRQVSLSGTWLFYSGAPMTLPVARFRFGSSYVPIYSSRNEDQMPDYHRADVSLTLRSKRRVADERWSGEWNISIYNLYSRHNAWTISYGYNEQKKCLQAYKVYLFPILPSVSYNLKF